MDGFDQTVNVSKNKIKDLIKFLIGKMHHGYK
jgi:hypothetical protein